MAQQIDPYRNEPATESYRAPGDRREPETAPTDEILGDLSRTVDRCAPEEADTARQKGLMQPMVWTMMMLVVLLGGWTLLVQEPALQPEPLDLNSFRAIPEILQVDVIPPDVLARVSLNRWMKLRPKSQIRLVENASRIALAAGYGSITLNSTDGIALARWRRAVGVEILHPKPESVNVHLP
jgi:hypothetical protein